MANDRTPENRDLKHLAETLTKVIADSIREVAKP